ncbi:MAG: nucleotide sugar dehydrogenase [Gammaproteobacteria bacterium]
MSHNRKISVIGLGYVGLPVAIAFAALNRVIGFDVNPERISALKKGIDKTNEVTAADLEKADILFTSNPDDLKAADFHIVAVPTPINAAKHPDLTALTAVSKTVGAQLKKGDIVVYESTVYPGATEEQCAPLLETMSGLRAGADFFVGYSPERINPGDKQHTFTTITKVVSGQNEETLDIVAQVYGSVVAAGVHRAPSIKVAEAAKVIENTQRDLNIALMNELALIFDRLQIDSGDVLAAAATKWNFLSFRPGLVGGHCIGVDPYYLTHKAAMEGYIPQVILAGRSINDGMGKFIASQVVKTMIKAGFSVSENPVTVLGVTFKENVPDTRNTRVIDIIHELNEYDIDIQVHDPEADREEVYREYGIKLKTFPEITPCRAVILAVAHAEYINGGWDIINGLLQDNKGIVFDVNRVMDRDTVPDGIQLERL